MIELLIQAEDAVAAGQLDQGERIYWQLVERDPRNAMAVAGLARIALDRGDLGRARALSAAALAIDPDGIAARKVAAALDAAGAPGLPAQAPDLAALAGERLAALGRRHAKDGAVNGEPLAAADDAVAPARPEPRRVGSSRRVGTQAADPFAAAEAAAAIEAIDAVDNLEIEPAGRRRRRTTGGTAAAEATEDGPAVGAALTEDAMDGLAEADTAVADARHAPAPEALAPEGAAPEGASPEGSSREAAAPDDASREDDAARGGTAEELDRGADIRWESPAGASATAASPAGSSNDDAARGGQSPAPSQDQADAGRRSRLLRRFLGR